MVLAVGFYYGYSARNARVQFDERLYLFYAITIELIFSSIFYIVRTIYPVSFNQNLRFAAAAIRGMLANNLVLFIIFIPKVAYTFLFSLFFLNLSFTFIIWLPIFMMYRIQFPEVFKQWITSNNNTTCLYEFTN